MWMEVPAPEEAKLYLPGSRFRSAISSGTVFTGMLTLTIKRFGTEATSDSGAKSFTWS